MTPPEITVELSTSDPVRLREEIAGRVRVRVRESVKSRGVDLGIGYRVSGDCYPWATLVQEVKGEPLEFRPETEFARDFKFRLPDQPITFGGKYFRLTWFVRVLVHLPFLSDMVEEREFVVLPARFQPSQPVPSSSIDAGRPPAQIPLEEPAPKRRGINPILVGLFFLLGGAGAFYYVSLHRGAPNKPIDQRSLMVAFAGMIALVLGMFITPIAVIYELVRLIFRRTPKPPR